MTSNNNKNQESKSKQFIAKIRKENLVAISNKNIFVFKYIVNELLQ